ncbi:MAG TPA: DUF1800 domain-containing protein [Candidatus Tectomicrobia bacterium]|nr:DUF1800 domain-containing protein [Candidatus Tectomicrobia bacterium]
MDIALSALNRFGLGARPGERDRIADPRGWLRAQLDGGPPLLASEPAADAAIGDAIRAFVAARRGDERERRQARRRLVEITLAEIRAALAARVTSERPFVERLVAFWSNHLCVSATGKLLVAPLAGRYEREAIRPHVLGRFDEMVLASARHPAMLIYLDNAQSIGPSSRAARRMPQGGTRRGLNENHARELLELHTLGVDGGYSQRDVQELARILTGWTIEGLGPGRAAREAPGGVIRFVFRDPLHEPGPKTLLGVRYEEAGAAEGERAIRALCRHPSTAQHVARKLVAHVVADEPPAAAVQRVAQAFHASGGDLRVTARALVDAPEAWSEDARKFRTPQDWLVAVLRALGAGEVSEAVPAALRQLRQPLWSPPSPKGFGDSLRDWADPDALLNRAELARTIGRIAAGRSADPRALLDTIEMPRGTDLAAVLADAAVPTADRLALVIAGPAFQWR